MSRARVRMPVRAALLVMVVAASCSPSPSATPSTSPTSTPQATEASVASVTPGPTSRVKPRVSHVTATVEMGVAPRDLDAIAFAADAIHGWAGGNGVILRTVDRGRTWAPAWTGDRTVFEITALDARTAWAVAGTQPAGEGRRIDTLLVTADGGAQWTRRRLPFPIGDLRVLSPSVAAAIELVSPESGPPTGRLVRTADAGRTWTASSSQPADAVCFANRFDGFAIGTHLLATHDGGRTWARTGVVPAPFVTEGTWLECSGTIVWLFVNLDDGAGGHQNYAGYRSTDGGRRWRQVLANPFYPGSPAGVAGASDEPGPLVALDGETAMELGVSPAAESSAVTATHDGGRTWTTVALEDVASSFGGGIVVPDATHAFVVASVWGRGLILESADGGRSWRQVYPTGNPDPVAAISFVSATTGFGLGIPGDAAAIVRTDDRGDGWEAVGRLPEPAAWLSDDSFAPALSFVDELHGWAVAAGHLYASTDGGRTWTRTTVPAPAAQVEGVAFADLLHGCVDGTSPDGLANAEVSTSDGGRTWSNETDLRAARVCAAGATGTAIDAAARSLFEDGRVPVLVSSGSTWWAEFEGNGIARTTDGGATWTFVDWPDPGSVGPTSISFGDALHGWFLTEAGALYATSDAGATWRRLP